MRLCALLFALITLCAGCKSAPKPVLPEAEEIALIEEAPPEEVDLSADEIKIINEVIDHVLKIITRELKNSRSDMQVCIDNEYYLYRVKSAGSYEADLKNAEQFIKNEMSLLIEEEMILSFITRNAHRKSFDKDVKFKADFFWKGERPQKNYFRINFSSIGFDKNFAKAIVYVCVDLPGWIFTEYVYLEKTNENWAYVNSKRY